MNEYKDQQPAAAQEAVAYWRVTFRMYPTNVNYCEAFVRGPARPTLETLGITPRPAEIISAEPLYAAPVTAAPEASYFEYLDRYNHSLRRAIHAMMAKLVFLLDEDQFADIEAIALSAGVTPAAPGIDLRRLLDSWRERSRQAHPSDAMLINRHIRELEELIDASPKDGSDARDAELKAAQDAGHDGAIRYVLGYLNGTGDCGGTMYEEILHACGRERIIKSAIADGELEFTGLAEYIKRDGTRTEKRWVRAALRAHAQAGDAEVQP